ncbi:MAG: hypothetical protein PVI01_02115 [Gemmatimonadales bacterium]|jgi:hypothetical protein
MSQRVGLVAALMVGLATGTPAAAQEGQVPRVKLSKPEASFPEPFSSIAGLRELPEGRVVVSDRLEIALRIVDLNAGTVEEIGHEGGGPGEYRMPGDLLWLPGDSTLLVDFGNMRLTTIAPDGTLGGSLGMMHPEGFMLFPRGTDAEGRLYFDRSNVMSMQPGESLPDSFAVVSLDRGTGVIDTIAMLPRPEVARVTSGGGGFAFSGSGVLPFESANDWAVARDGRVALAWGDDYRLEWRSRGGGGVVGPVVAYEPVEITRADKEAWADRMSSASVSVVSTGGGSGRSRAFSMPRPDIDALDWPEVKPPFGRSAVSVTPEGEAWVRRYVAAGDPETYDVFDAAARRVRQVVLPSDRRLVGFGRGVLYAVYVDGDDLQWLERYGISNIDQGR